MGQRSWASILLDKGTILESLATNVVDRTMIHADCGNFRVKGLGKGRNQPEEKLLSSCVQLSTGCRSWEFLGFLVAQSKDEQNCQTRIPYIVPATVGTVKMPHTNTSDGLTTSARSRTLILWCATLPMYWMLLFPSHTKVGCSNLRDLLSEAPFDQSSRWNGLAWVNLTLLVHVEVGTCYGAWDVSGAGTLPALPSQSSRYRKRESNFVAMHPYL